MKFGPRSGCRTPKLYPRIGVQACRVFFAGEPIRVPANCEAISAFPSVQRITVAALLYRFPGERASRSEGELRLKASASTSVRPLRQGRPSPTPRVGVKHAPWKFATEMRPSGISGALSSAPISTRSENLMRFRPLIPSSRPAEDPLFVQNAGRLPCSAVAQTRLLP